jgi:tetratricopeptide (TPR) repeat protein
MSEAYKMMTVACLAACLLVLPVHAFEKQETCPEIEAKDIYGKPVNLDMILGEEQDLLILFFFSVKTSEDLAVKLHSLDTSFGGSEIEIIALGIQDEAAALKAFAETMNIQYYIISRETLETAAWKEKVEVLPTTLFVTPLGRKIERVLKGVNDRNINILTHIAENFYQQRKLEKAQNVADQALDSGEDACMAREVKGFSLAAAGKLDDAEAEFGAIGSKTGLAAVALEKGDLDKAVELADEADDAYAAEIKGRALIKSGRIDEASEVIAQAEGREARDWQRAEIANTSGRIAQHQGKPDTAMAQYQQAVALDPYNVVALSNEGAVLREQGKLDKAEAVLAKASKIRADDMTAVMLRQVQQELREANDVKRHELIRQQIADLSARYEKMKEEGAAQPADDWSTRPLVLALLPSKMPGSVFFERAGADIVLQRELEAQLQTDPRVRIVERQMLSQLLEELNLGSSELTSADTQKRLGKVLSAGQLGFIDFASMGPDIQMYVRLVDTETTAITFQTSKKVEENNPGAVVRALTAEILQAIAEDRELKGLIADAGDENAVIINLGARHGITAGQQFTAYVDGDPIEVGGRVIAHRQKPVAKLEVTTVEAEYALCAVTGKRDGTTLEKAMKIKAEK